MKDLSSISLGDLSAEYMTVYLVSNVNDKDYLHIEVEDENGINVLSDKIHKFAAESLADFCRQYLRIYKKGI